MFMVPWVSREVSGDKFRNLGKWYPKSKQGGITWASLYSTDIERGKEELKY